MENINMRVAFYENLSKKRQSNNSFQLSAEKHRKIIEDVKRAKNGKKENRHYNLLKHYDVITVDGVDQLIFPKVNNKILYYTPVEDLFDILYKTHESVGHGGRDRMRKVLQDRYKNVTLRDIQTFINICQFCSQKRKSDNEKKVKKPLIHSQFRSRCQVDLIDFQSKEDTDYKFIMVYKDYLTKYIILRALRSNEAEEVAHQLLDIFLLFGAPMIIQSNNKREFCNKILDELKLLWPELKILLGKPSNIQSQSNMKVANHDIENMLTTWMQEHQCRNWSKSLGFVQFMKNQMLYGSTNKSPYEAMFNQPPKIGLASFTLPKGIIQDINTEEDLERVLEKEAVQEEYMSEQEDADIWQDSLLEEEDKEEPQKQETALSDTEFNIEHKKCVICRMELSSSNNDLCTSCSRPIKIENVEVQAKRMKFLPDISPSEIQVEKTDHIQILDVEDEELAFVSVNGKQPRHGFVKCHCKTDCNSKKCMCRRMKLLCTTKCHSVLACCNCN